MVEILSIPGRREVNQTGGGGAVVASSIAASVYTTSTLVTLVAFLCSPFREGDNTNFSEEGSNEPFMFFFFLSKRERALLI